MMPPEPFLVLDGADVWERGITPAYEALLDWCRSEGIVPENAKRCEVYGGSRPHALVTYYERDENGHMVWLDPESDAATRIERVKLSSLPPVVAE